MKRNYLGKLSASAPADCKLAQRVHVAVKYRI